MLYYTNYYCVIIYCNSIDYTLFLFKFLNEFLGGAKDPKHPLLVAPMSEYNILVLVQKHRNLEIHKAYRE